MQKRNSIVGLKSQKLKILNGCEDNQDKQNAPRQIDHSTEENRKRKHIFINRSYY